ncbi:MAG: hypothetical protein Q9163_002873 [Psora crenata]
MPYEAGGQIKRGEQLAIGATILTCRLQHRFTQQFSFLTEYGRFFYASFLKPHGEERACTGQQAALESFYKAQADAYDGTRRILLRGREDMLGLVASQLKLKASSGTWSKTKPVWVDIGGGTGYNIEAMQAYLDVPNFFAEIYLVDLSPSLLDVARKRFTRLGWDVRIVCQDARDFKIPDHEMELGADLVTLSYSLSMIPDYFSVIDAIQSLLSVHAVVGVVDFYVQSIVDLGGRNYTGGSFNRHVNWLGRVFWRAWFDIDRVGLEGARRDYLEYRFGTLKTVDERNYLLGGIPYYRTPRGLACPTLTSPDYAQKLIEDVDASCRETPYFPLDLPEDVNSQDNPKLTPIVMRSKAYQSAVVNLCSNIPLPSTFYQNNHRRIYYDEQLRNYTQFGKEYIYSFTWEDPRVDQRLLKIGSNDTVLCVTSAGDNVLDYILQAAPRRIHAVDLNPNQNHLLELKVAAFQSLPYSTVWAMFGEGKLSTFRELLITQLSPHLSSQAFQYWLSHTNAFTASGGLYETGGSGHAVVLTRWIFRLTGLTTCVEQMCCAETLNEQRELWSRIRRVLLSKALHWTIIGTEWFAWKAAGVPPAQRRMIMNDHTGEDGSAASRGEAIWKYIVDTLDPVARDTLISDDNYFYFLCLQGRYSPRSRPNYLSPKAHARLSRPGAFDCLRIHTDELLEVIARISSGSLDHAIIMDSMDWFEPHDAQAPTQVQALHRALKIGGKVLLRSAGFRPWYISIFEAHGFTTRRAGARSAGTCIDR